MAAFSSLVPVNQALSLPRLCHPAGPYLPCIMPQVECLAAGLTRCPHAPRVSRCSPEGPRRLAHFGRPLCFSEQQSPCTSRFTQASRGFHNMQFFINAEVKNAKGNGQNITLHLQFKIQSSLSLSSVPPPTPTATGGDVCAFHLPASLSFNNRSCQSWDPSCLVHGMCQLDHFINQ